MIKSSMKKIQVITGMALCATLLTACDPPMPPELLAQIAEQSYTCYEGNVSVFAESANTPVIDTLSESLAGACIGELPIMTVTSSQNAATADLAISATTVAECKAFASVPYGFDAGLVAYNVEGTDTLNVGYKNLVGILNGDIANWNDPKIAKDNPDLELPDLPILVRKLADSSSLLALKGALEINSANLNSSKFDGINLFDGADFAPLQPGEVAIVSNSYAIANGLTSIGLLTGKKDPDSGEKLVAIASDESLYAAGTQLVTAVNGQVLSATIDPKVLPKAMFEGEAAALPYQALFPVTLYLCGDDTKLKRAVAAFMLRLDSQGALGYLNISQLPEAIRYSAVGIVRKGLPVPKVTKQNK